MVKKYSMWVEKIKPGKYKYSQRYIDPLRSAPGKIAYKKVSVTLTKKTAQAKRQAESMLAKKIEKELEQKSKGTEITLKDLTDKYEQHLKETDRPWNTRQRAHFNFKFINQYFDGAIAQNLTTPMINKYLEYCLYKRPRKLSNSSTRLRKVFISNAYRFGIKYGYVNINPVVGVEIKWRDESAKKRNEIENKYFTNEELRAFLGYTKYIAGRMDYYYLFKFMSVTGMRVSEATGLTKKDFYTDGTFWYAKIIGNQEYHYGALYHAEEEGEKRSKKYDRTKTANSTRNVQLNSVALKIYRSLAEFRKDDEPLFRNNYFKSPWKTFTVDGYMKTIGRKLGINKICTSHLFRHTYISKLAEQGQPLPVIMRQVGQADSNITKQIYTHVTEIEQHKLDLGLEAFDKEIGV